MIPDDETMPESETNTTDELCLACAGSGAWDLFDAVPCENCGGSGLVPGASK
jgi:hypothetical protein